MCALSSLQPSRIKVIDQIRTILDTSSKENGLPARLSHRELATRVYGSKEPTTAQLSAVRRAVARLVARGQAKRDRDVEYVGYHQRAIVKSCG